MLQQVGDRPHGFLLDRRTALAAQSTQVEQLHRRVEQRVAARGGAAALLRRRRLEKLARHRHGFGRQVHGVKDGLAAHGVGQLGAERAAEVDHVGQHALRKHGRGAARHHNWARGE